MKVSKEYIIEQIQKQIAEEAEKYLFKHLTAEEYECNERVGTGIMKIESGPSDVVIDFRVVLTSEPGRVRGKVSGRDSMDPYAFTKTITRVGRD